MKKSVVFLFIFITYQTFGQKHFIGLQTGLNMANATPDYWAVMNEKRIGFTGGITYEFFPLKWLVLGTKLNYEQRGHTEHQVAYYTTYNSPPDEDRLHFNYFSLPVKAGVLLGRNFFVMANIGVVPAWLISAKDFIYTWDNNNGMVLNETRNVKTILKNFDFGGLAEVGLGYKFGKRIMIYASYSRQQSFTWYINENYADMGNEKHQGHSVSLGVRVGL